MTVWMVTCDVCPYQERFEMQSQAQLEALRHVRDNPLHRPRVDEETRR